MSRVVVIGAGIGGLAVAIRLAAAGHEVTVCERNARFGGKLATFERAGYRFDLGPSLLTLPHVFDELFQIAGTSLAAQVELVRLDPQFHYHWPDGTTLVMPDDPSRAEAAFERIAVGAGAARRAFDARGRRIWDVSERTFLAGPMAGPVSLARRLRGPGDLLAIDPLRTLARSAAAHFADPRLRQWAGRYATYSGSSPYRAPATLACIPHIESRFGCWYVVGGLGALADALERVARQLGVELRSATEVTRVTTHHDRVTGVTLADGSPIVADVVVANADADHLYRDVLPDEAGRRRARRAEPSTSAFVVCAGVRGHTPGIGHHNVWFSADDRAEFDALSAGVLAPDPTLYACISSVTDATRAPDGCENWFVLQNVPAGVAIDRGAQAGAVLALLARRGVDLRDRIEVLETLTPADFERRDRSLGGAIYGSSSNGIRAAFQRPPNRGTRRGLYLVGGSSHPGGGLPLVATSARIVATMIAEDRR